MTFEEGMAHLDHLGFSAEEDKYQMYSALMTGGYDHEVALEILEEYQGGC